MSIVDTLRRIILNGFLRNQVTSANIVINAQIDTRRLFVKAEINNIFDRDYEVFQNYPMPGRNFRVTLGFEY